VGVFKHSETLETAIKKKHGLIRNLSRKMGGKKRGGPDMGEIQKKNWEKGGRGMPGAKRNALHQGGYSERPL